MLFRRTLFCPLACAVVWWAGFASAAWSQGTEATLGGKVVDPQGGAVPAVPDVTTIVAAGATGVKQQTSTNEQGNWIVQALIPGTYSFTVSAPGFGQAERKGIELQTGDKKLVDLRLELGATAIQVDVVGETPLIDTTAATSGTVVTREEIAEMPSM